MALFEAFNTLDGFHEWQCSLLFNAIDENVPFGSKDEVGTAHSKVCIVVIKDKLSHSHVRP